MRGLSEIRETNDNPHDRREELFGGRAHPGDPSHANRSFESNLAKYNRKRDANFAAKNDAILEGILNDLVGNPTSRKVELQNPVNELAGLLALAAIIDGVGGPGIARPRNRLSPFLGMDGVESAIDAEPVFLKFWRKLNDDRTAMGMDEAGYRDAKEAFLGGKTPVGAMTFIGKQWDGLRAVPAEPVKYLGGVRPAYHGEYREVTDRGTVWHKVTNDNDLPIAYKCPEAAVCGAEHQREEKIAKAFR